MTQFQIDTYRIEVYSEQNFDQKSVADINKYDFTYFEESEFRCTSFCGVRVFENDAKIKSAVIGACGGGTGIYDKSVIMESNRILICCSNSIFCLSIPNLELLWQTKADWATCFGIYKYKENYIVHGELMISRIDKDGKIVWQQTGADIFTTLERKDSFEITDKFILATDWENRKYKFDFNGQVIT